MCHRIASNALQSEGINFFTFSEGYEVIDEESFFVQWVIHFFHFFHFGDKMDGQNGQTKC
jgi:hypothetical protein